MSKNKKDDLTGLRKQLKELKGELSDAVDRQKATGEILQVISSYPRTPQPVFETIVEAGQVLFRDAIVSIALQIENEVRVTAIAGPNPEDVEAWRRLFPAPLKRDTLHGFVMLEGKLVDVPNVAIARSPIGDRQAGKCCAIDRDRQATGTEPQAASVRSDRGQPSGDAAGVGFGSTRSVAGTAECSTDAATDQCGVAIDEQFACAHPLDSTRPAGTFAGDPAGRLADGSTGSVCTATVQLARNQHARETKQVGEDPGTCAFGSPASDRHSFRQPNTVRLPFNACGHQTGSADRHV